MYLVNLQTKMAGVVVYSPTRISSQLTLLDAHWRADGGESQGPRSTRGERAATVKLIMPGNVA